MKRLQLIQSQKNQNLPQGYQLLEVYKQTTNSLSMDIPLLILI